ncbi:MAG: DinB family protein [Thermoanaerobaculia bacterium]
MIGRPGRDEAAEYYFRYIDRIEGDDILGALEGQLPDTLRFLRKISEEQSLHRYEPGKWSVRQVLNHVNDCERVFAARAFWFARGFDSPLPSFDQNVSATAAGAHDVAWARHVEEFEGIRRGTLSLFRNLPEEAWTRAGTASGYLFSVRALAYITGGHVAHHRALLRERYL